MIRFSAIFCLVLLLAGCSSLDSPATHLEKAPILPLSIDDSYQFGKILQKTLNSSVPQQITTNDVINFERARDTWGCYDQNEVARRNGNYYVFYWHNSKKSDVTIRLEYRQAGMGNFVMAQERNYPATKGSHRSPFQVNGDDFLENGRVTSWRAILIVNNKIVALTQSYLWK